MATYAIGDIHGRSDLLRALLLRIHPSKNDVVVFLGDYIDRGSDSRGVIDRLIEYERSVDAQVVFLLGNHEQWLIETMDDYTDHSWLFGMAGLSTVQSYSAEAAELLRCELNSVGTKLFEESVGLSYGPFFGSMPDRHTAFFRNLRPFVRTSEVVCVHAGLSPGSPTVETVPEKVLIWGIEDWWNSYRGKDLVVYGHWGNARKLGTSMQPNFCGNTVGIDCSNEGKLMAIRFPDREFWIVE
jgi:serine/threonine protein phosphatase 1